MLLWSSRNWFLDEPRIHVKPQLFRSYRVLHSFRPIELFSRKTHEIILLFQTVATEGATTGSDGNNSDIEVLFATQNADVGGERSLQPRQQRRRQRKRRVDDGDDGGVQKDGRSDSDVTNDVPGYVRGPARANGKLGFKKSKLTENDAN